ncbi:MAG: efflux RND transporter periplasmic adaptor subunit, partial [Elusimicrobia bacterium]|nr:efflux RND transporter periplasmic adaptor subunit [Elusimicrobiota bacterium]
MSGQAKKWLIGTVVLALVGGGGWWAWKVHAKSAADDAGKDTSAEVTQGDLETHFQEIGDIAAKNAVNVASKVSGRVIELDVQEGAHVSAGQKVAVVQPGKTGAEKFLPSEVHAPIQGVVLTYIKEGSNDSNGTFVHVGDYVTGLFDSQNPTYIMTVADMRVVIVKMRINEMDVLKLRQGMPVDVLVDAIPGAKFPASITMISPQAEEQSRGGKVFRVEVTLAKPDPRLRTGMTARVDALLERHKDVLRLPLTGLFEEKGAEVAYL